MGSVSCHDGLQKRVLVDTFLGVCNRQNQTHREHESSVGSEPQQWVKSLQSWVRRPFQASAAAVNRLWKFWSGLLGVLGALCVGLRNSGRTWWQSERCIPSRNQPFLLSSSQGPVFGISVSDTVDWTLSCAQSDLGDLVLTLHQGVSQRFCPPGCYRRGFWSKMLLVEVTSCPCPLLELGEGVQGLWKLPLCRDPLSV